MNILSIPARLHRNGAITAKHTITIDFSKFTAATRTAVRTVLKTHCHRPGRWGVVDDVIAQLASHVPGLSENDYRRVARLSTDEELKNLNAKLHLIGYGLNQTSNPKHVYVSRVAVQYDNATQKQANMLWDQQIDLVGPRVVFTTEELAFMDKAIEAVESRSKFTFEA